MMHRCLCTVTKGHRRSQVLCLAPALLMDYSDVTSSLQCSLTFCPCPHSQVMNFVCNLTCPWLAFPLQVRGIYLTCNHWGNSYISFTHTLVSSFYVAVTILDSVDTAVNKTDKKAVIHRAHIQDNKLNNNIVNTQIA
jgi:hypothetical protein